MTGIDRARRPDARTRRRRAEFPPVSTSLPRSSASSGSSPPALDAGGPLPLAIARTLVGAAFLGAVTDAMLLGHWYLVQPGLARGPLNELVRWLAMDLAGRGRRSCCARRAWCRC